MVIRKDNFSFHCICQKGFIGKTCGELDQNFDPTQICVENDCKENELCVVNENESPECQQVDPCGSIDCPEKSVCQVEFGENGKIVASCQCQPGWMGPNCDQDFDECIVASAHGELVCGDYGT